jgi:hypothetical protein
MRRWPAWVSSQARRFVWLSAAVALTLGAFVFKSDAVLPTLAFFCWAYLFARLAIDLPGILGLFGSEAEEESHDDDRMSTFDDLVWEGREALGAGDLPRAQARFEAAEAVVPGRVEVAVGLAATYRRTGRVAESLRVLEDAERLHAGVTSLHLELARAFCDAGEADRAIEQVEVVLAITPELRPTLANDPDLAALRRNPVFRALIGNSSF